MKTKQSNNTQKILVADDDPAIVESTTLILEESGYQVSSTVNGETIYKMEKDMPDLLLLDIWMSGQDGREICKYLKKKEQTKHIPIIMISASKDVAQSAKDAGSDDFITKPYDMYDLLAIVKKHLENTN
ncbi:MAG TPA: response regulator [Candidatus Limnocylindrales bacterium]|nr:response regulator [Candidatus Limnocylindrales bacterium]